MEKTKKFAVIPLIEISRPEVLAENWRHPWDNIPDNITELDDCGIILNLNRIPPNFRKNELVGKNLFDFIPPNQHKTLNHAMDQVRKTSSPQYFEIHIIMPHADSWWSNRIIPLKRFGKISSFMIVSHDITEKRRKEDELKLSRRDWRALVENTPDHISVIDRFGRYIFINHPFPGYRKEELLDRTFFHLLPQENHTDLERLILSTLEKDITQTFESHLQAGTSNYYYKHRIFPIAHKNKTLTLCIVSTDITPEKKQLIGHEALLREIQHRVKNNLQAVSSLLSLQSRCATDEMSRRVVTNCLNRIKAMALAHEQLQFMSSSGKSNFSKTIHDLASLLLKTPESNPDNLSLEFDLEPLSLLADATVPCGLIINELLSNALKHAVPPKGTKNVRITFKQTGNSIVTLSIYDNGRGLPEDFDFSSPATLGLQLVNNLVSQLGGRLSLKKEDGFCVVVEFPVNIIA